MKIDKAISKKIHTMDLPIVIQIWIYIWARAFNRGEAFYWLGITLFVVPNFLKNHYPYPRVYFGLIQYGCGMICFSSIRFLKKAFRRSRPKHNASIYRIQDLRTKEHETSFPSGDSAAAACYSGFMYLFLYEIVE